MCKLSFIRKTRATAAKPSGGPQMANSFVHQPSQYELNNPDDYTRALKKQYEKSDVPKLEQ
jgi:hypothetical protein